MHRETGPEDGPADEGTAYQAGKGDLKYLYGTGSSCHYVGNVCTISWT